MTHIIVKTLKQMSKIKKVNTPISLIYLSTFRCNAKCKHCYFWKEINKDYKELTIEELEKITDTLGKLNDFSISGGEPFLRNDNAEICKVFEKLDPIEVCIPTNGTLTKEIEKQTIEILEAIDYRVMLSISLDGLQQTHDKIRGIKAFEKVEKTCHLIHELKESYENLNFKITTVISDRNYTEIKKLSEYVYETLNPSFHSFEIVRGVPRDAILPPIKELKRLKPVVMDTYKKYDFALKGLHSNLAIALKSLLFDYYIDVLEQKICLPCLAGNLTGVLYPDGEVRLCELTEGVGNVRDHDYDFRKVWYSQKADALRKSFKACSCTHTCFQIQNVKYNPKMWLKLMRYLI